ncbi:MAG: TRAP transporter small permease [Gammaproteobacteria bacterium]
MFSMTAAVRFFHRMEDAILAIVLTAMILIASAQIALRNLFDLGFAWTDPLLRIMVLWLGLLGALAASRENKHINIDALSRLLPGRSRFLAQFVTALFTSIVCGVVAGHGVRFVMLDWETGTIAFAGIPAWWLETIIPFAFAVIALRYLLLAYAGVVAFARSDR